LIDVLATIPAMVTMQKFKVVNCLKFFRLVHIDEMFEPFKSLIDCIMTKSIAKARNDVYQLIVLFAAALLFGHLLACIWIAIGTLEGGWLR